MAGGWVRFSHFKNYLTIKKRMPVWMRFLNYPEKPFIKYANQRKQALVRRLRISAGHPFLFFL